ncbi:hypothetical protein JTE90_016780 [Oedothorax gibbosus]|uniref:Uncharacterized protein n=1 Tax=Oedothorax gibbosus TaxID=931172 RepID=A0AAV6VYM6_9ARAC|nr:hypothetical protein JTE90_016780 [Oedothorax gibbosus]
MPPLARYYLRIRSTCEWAAKGNGIFSRRMPRHTLGPRHTVGSLGNPGKEIDALSGGSFLRKMDLIAIV